MSLFARAWVWDNELGANAGTANLAQLRTNTDAAVHDRRTYLLSQSAGHVVASS